MLWRRTACSSRSTVFQGEAGQRTTKASSLWLTRVGLSRFLVALLLSLASSVAPPSVSVAHAAPTGYVYDDLGRLTGVVDPSGESARYNYDALGNVVSVDRYGVGAIAILQLLPSGAPIGASVAIQGIGFGATPAENSVTFNGATAVVTSATTTNLVVTVPAGATTGRVAVTSPAGTALSPTDFVVSTDPASPPVITGFTPTTGTVGTSVTIAGSNFVSAQTRVLFNRTLASGATITASSVTVAVPDTAGSGKIHVVTPAGTATSAADFVVPPTGIAVGDIVATQRIVVDGPSQALSVATANKVGALLFDAEQGAVLSFDLTALAINLSSSTVAYEVYSPHNVKIAWGNVSSTNRSIHLQPLPMVGTYALYFKPGSSTVSLATSLFTNQNTITVDGASWSGTLGFSGQSKRFTFSGIGGQSLGLGINALALNSGGSTYADVAVFRPDGNQYIGAICNQSTGGCGPSLSLIPYGSGYLLTNLPVSGTYSVVVSSRFGDTGNFTATLSSDVGAVLTPNTAFSLNLARPGQNGRLTVSGTAGQQLGLTLKNIVLQNVTPSNAAGSVTVYKPDGTSLASATFTNNSVPIIDVPVLPVTGTYTVFVDPPYAATGTIDALLTADVQATLDVDGGSSDVAISLTGQTARLTFDGTAGQDLGLGVSNLVLTPSNSSYYATFQVLKPDGTAFTSINCGAPGCSKSFPTLPVTGTYTIVVTPYQGGTASFTATLSTDASWGSIEIDAASLSDSVTRQGQTARFSFVGAAGQNLGLGISNLITSPVTSTLVDVSVFKADGSQIGGASCFVANGGCGANLVNLPVTGVYTVKLTPRYGGTFSLTATLSSDVSAALTPDTAFALGLARSGQNGRLTCSGTAGQQLGLALKNVVLQNAMPSSATGSLTVYKPDGTSLASTTFQNNSQPVIDLPVLSATGTYTVFVDPPYGTTGSMDVVLSSDVIAALNVDGPSTDVVIDQTGQTARLTFNGTAGENLGLGISSFALTPSSSSYYATFQILKPDGISLSTMYCYVSNGGCSRNLVNLPVTGTYTIVVTPYQGGTGGFTATLSTDFVDTLVAGTPYSLNLSRPGQNARLVFDATAGTSRTLTIASLATSPASNIVYFTVYRPDGSTQTNASTSGSSLIINLASLPATGTYTLFVDPNGHATATATVTLSP